MRNSYKSLLAATLVSTALVSASQAFAQYAIENPGTLNNQETYGIAISADGSRIVGRSINTNGEYEIYTYSLGGSISGLGAISGHYQFTGDPAANTFISSNGNVVGGIGQNRTVVRWTSGGGLVDLGAIPGGAAYMDPIGMNRNGSAIVGRAYNGQWTAFLWRDGAGFIEIPTLGGYRDARVVNADGTAVAGYENGNLYRWTSSGGTVSYGKQPGGYTDTIAMFMSDDGDTISGFSVNGTFSKEAFRWTNSGGFAGLGTLGGNSSDVFAMNPTGTVIVGESLNASAQMEAFKWTASDNTMHGLGILNGSGSSSARAVNAAGTRIVGTSNGEAVMWDENNAIHSLTQLLTDNGVTMTGWSLVEATGLSDDGTKIVGNGVFNGVQNAFIYTGPGITTPQQLAESFTPALTSSQQLQSSVAQGVGQSMMIARNALSGYFSTPSSAGRGNEKSFALLSPAAGGDYDPTKTKRRKAVFATGSFGAGQENDFSNNNLSGNMGVLLEVNPNTAIGVGVISSNSRVSTRLGGESRSYAKGGSAMVSFEGDTGLRLYGTAFLADLGTSSERHYMNGSGIDESRGKSDGTGYGAAAMAGYEFNAGNNIRLMPYLETQWSRTSLNSYTETGGAMPMTVAEQNDSYITSRLGGQISHDLTPDMTLRGRAAWGHRYTTGAATAATIAGITQVMPAFDGDRDWAEAGFTVNYKVSPSTTFSADLSGRSSQTAEPAATGTIGIVWSWY